MQGGYNKGYFLILFIYFSQQQPNILKKQYQTRKFRLFKEFFFTKILIVAYCHDTNLKDILVHKKHNGFFYKPNKCEPCGKNCAIFPHLRNTSKFSDSEENEYSIQNYVYP